MILLFEPKIIRMKKLLFLLCTTFLITSVTQAQHSAPIFSIGIEPSLPIGTFGDISSFGIGASAQGEIRPSSNLGLTLNVGYISYTYKPAIGGSVGFIPVLAGAKYFFSPKVYGHAQLGASFPSGGGSTSFTYSPGIGFQLSKAVDALIKFTGMSSGGYSYNSLGLRLAYNFGQ